MSISARHVFLKSHMFVSNKIAVCLCCFRSTPLNGTFWMDRLGGIDPNISDLLIILLANLNHDCVPVDNELDSGTLGAGGGQGEPTFDITHHHGFPRSVRSRYAPLIR